MPLDIKILSQGTDGRLHDQTYPVPDKVDGSYALVQKIVKNLKTDPGMDEQDPGWGSGLFTRLLAIPSQLVEAARLTTTGALQKCARDITSVPVTDPALQVQAIHLLSLTYNDATTAWDVTIEVVTAGGTIQVPLNS